MPDSKPAIYRDPFAPGDDPRRQRGRKTGSRAKLAKKFFEDTYAAWEAQGESALARAAFHDPMGFVSMVARLMPQKIEVSTPTDGMTDERLAEMIDYYERIAALRAKGVATPLLAHELTDENGVTIDAAQRAGGGADALTHAQGRNTPSTFTADPGRIAETPFNKLCCSDCATPLSKDGLCPKCDSAPPAASPPPSPSNLDGAAALPYPVGRPFPKPDIVVERANRAALAEEDIDPMSLF